MNNRIGGLLILGSMCIIGYIFYWYYFIYSLITITFVSNVETFTLSLESSQKKYDFECKNYSCEYNNIAPFEYIITAQSPEYKDIKYNWKASQKIEIKNFEFEKDYQLKQIEKIPGPYTNKNKQNIETIPEKMKKLKEQQSAHLIIKVGQKKYIFKKSVELLTLYQNESLLGVFPYANKGNISLQEIEGNSNYLSLTFNNQQYIYSKKTGVLKKYFLDIPIRYIKKSDKNGEFIFVTEKGSFVYNIYTNIFRYNNYFSDFVFFDKNSFVGIIYHDDTDKINRGKYRKGGNKNIIIQFIPEGKEEKILLETEKQIEKILKQDGRIYFIDKNKETYIISHLSE